MYQHTELGDTPFARKRAIVHLITTGQITLAGYSRGEIYGTLSCKSGKRMSPANRVFFKNEAEALAAGYRPCGHCLQAKYKTWKANK